MTIALLLGCFAHLAAPRERARAIEIWSEHPIAVEIAWLTIDDAGIRAADQAGRR